MPAFSLDRLVRPNVARMAAYSSARSEFAGHAQVMLDANENPFDTGFNRYPDPLQLELKRALLARPGTPAHLTEAELFLGNGSDEAIDLLMRAFCVPGQGQVLIQPPTYGMYEVSAALQDAPVLRVPLGRDFQPDYPALLGAVGEATRLVFFCSPNNPTANLLEPDAILAFAQRCPALVVVDEAYIDFALAVRPEVSLLPHVGRVPNLVVLQTFSKALGHAGIRLGMAWAHASVIALFTKIKPPYNLSQPAQQAALNALNYGELTNRLVELIVAQREALAAALKELDFVEHVYPSDANFLLVKVDQPAELYRHLRERGIIVRDRSSVAGCEGCLRISVGTPDENAKLLEALAQFTPQPARP